MQTTLVFWYFVLGLPLLAWGAFALAAPTRAAAALVAFPRNRAAGRVLAAVAWLWTAHELDVIGIAFFDSFLKIFPGELWLLAAVLAVLTCAWMENLLPIRGLAAVFMLYPASLFPAIRLCDTPWRLALVVVAYACATAGMFAMFYPWHVRRFWTWRAASAKRMRLFGAAFAAVGAMLAVLGGVAAAGGLT